MDMSSAPADAGQEQDLSGGEGEQLPRLSQRCINSAHACAAFLWCRPTSPDRARPPGAAVGDAQPRGDVGAVGTHWRPSEAAFGADVGSIATRDTYLHRFSGTWRARLPSASRCARLPGEPRRAPHAPPLCGSPTSTAQLVSPAHVRISRPDNFPHSSPGQAHTMGASESARFDFFIPDSILGSAGSCQMRRPAPSAWLLLRGMRPVRTARVRASDVASCGALHASRKLDLVLPPFSGQAYGAGSVESCALMAAPRLLERRFSTRDTFPGRQNRLRINRGYGDHRRHLTAHPLLGETRWSIDV